MGERYDCVIIGAGASGLAAGVTLHGAGKSVLLLEARDHIGGRAHSTALSDGTPAERGAQVIHGQTVATWDLVARFGFATHARTPKEKGTGSMGIYRGHWLREDNPADRATLDLFQQMPEALDIPLEAVAGDTVSVHQAYVNAALDEAQIELLEGVTLLLTGIGPGENSAYATAHRGYWKAGSVDFQVVPGYSRLWAQFSAPIASSIRLSTPVSAVGWSDGGVTVTAGARTFEAHTAVVTLPLGVLQSGSVQFRPELPARKRAAIAGLRMGQLIKVLAEYRRPWWEDTLGRVTGIYSDALVNYTIIPFWNRPGPPFLVSFICADAARELSGDRERISTAYLAALQEMFPNVDVAGEVVSLDVVDWPSDPWALGAISAAPVGGYRLRADLARPMPPLFWAGEAANDMGNASTVHGALEAGRRAALQALHAMRPLWVADPNSRLEW